MTREGLRWVGAFLFTVLLATFRLLFGRALRREAFLCLAGLFDRTLALFFDGILSRRCGFI
jgi:hypothetical protein